MAPLLILCLFALSSAIALAQNAPSYPPQQPGPQQPGPQQPGMQQQQPDPNAVPMAPPTFAPGVGAGNDEVSAQRRSVRISGGVMAGQIVSKVDPVYPEAARAAGLQGSVVLTAHIGTDGHVENLAAVSGPALLQPAAVDAVRQWIYRPYRLNGQFVDVDTTVTVNFRLPPKR